MKARTAKCCILYAIVNLFFMATHPHVEKDLQKLIKLRSKDRFVDQSCSGQWTKNF